MGEKKIEIKLPEQKVDKEEIKARIRRMFKEDLGKGEGLLSKILVFIYLEGVIAITDLTLKLQNYYKREIDRVVVYRNADRLVNLGLLYKATSGDVLSMPEEEKEIVHKLIEAKHRKFLSKIPPQFRKRYNDRNYIWVSNGIGTEYLKWCCEINGFEYKEKDEKK